MSVPERLAPLDEHQHELDPRAGEAVAAVQPAEWRPPLAPVAAVFTSSIVFKTPIRTPSDAAIWGRALRETGVGTHAASLFDRYRNVAAAWLTDAAEVDAVLTYALSIDIRKLAGRELVILSAVEELRPTSADDRRAFSGMVKRTRRRNAALLDWVVAGPDGARSMRLAVEPGNDWPSAVEIPGWEW